MIILLSFQIISVLIILQILFYQYKRIKTLEANIKQVEKKGEELVLSQAAMVKADLFFSRELKAMTADIVSMDKQLQALENVRHNDGSYQHALRILEMGGDKGEIVKSCHLSTAEADLLMNLNAYRAAIKS
jgi:hypothetical protein